jgi:hypothetical protein
LKRKRRNSGEDMEKETSEQKERGLLRLPVGSEI